MPKRLIKTRRRAGTTTIIALLAMYTILNLFNKGLNASHVAQNGFQMGSYHPWTFWIALIGGIIWLVASWKRKLGIWWFVPGVLGVIYAVYMIAGGYLIGWFF